MFREPLWKQRVRPKRAVLLGTCLCCPPWKARSLRPLRLEVGKGAPAAGGRSNGHRPLQVVILMVLGPLSSCCTEPSVFLDSEEFHLMAASWPPFFPGRSAV